MTVHAWYVYIVRCSDRTLYTGVTTDIERRVGEHNGKGRGARYTRARQPVTLVWSEVQPDRGAALRREYRIKQLTRKEKKKLIAQGQGESA